MPDSPTFAGYGEDAPLPLTATQAAEAQVSFTPRYWEAWAETASRVGHCTSPIRLRGTSTRIDAHTGEVIHHYNTDSEPLGFLHTRCGNRRASECPSCSRLYARDTFELIRSGVIGGKTVPDTIADNPLVFATLTAPSFGKVHNSIGKPRQTHTEAATRETSASMQGSNATTAPEIGSPVCEQNYDYKTHIVWQWWAPELWRRFTIALRRAIASALGVAPSRLKDVATLQYAKVAEYQARGAIHFHALIRLDGPSTNKRFSAAPDTIDVRQLTAIVSETIANVSYTAPPVTPDDRPRTLRFGTQFDVRPVRAQHRPDDPESSLSGPQVAGYLAKYATKSAADSMPSGSKHHATLRTTCDQLARAAFANSPSGSPYLLLRKWAHMLGFRGHFSTKSRAYSVTLGALRRARARFQRLVADSHRTGTPLDVRDLEARLLAEDEEESSTLVVNSLSYASHGWNNATETALALAAASRAQEYAQWKTATR